MTESGIDGVSNQADRKNRFLLVVDSDANNLIYTSMLLKRFDYQTCTAKTAREALEMTKVAVPSLIITALDLKDMHGLDLIQHVKNNIPTAEVPFIALRKPGAPMKGQRGAEVPAVECLYQPVSAELLYRAVQAAVETKPRSHIRIRTLQPVKVDDLQFTDLEGVCITELSERGMFLRTKSPAAVNTRLSVQIYLYGQIIGVEAVVIYSDGTGAGPYRYPGMGLQFIRIAPQDQELIRRFIHGEVLRGIGQGNA
jgi:CheY-like chemotaxis protein